MPFAPNGRTLFFGGGGGSHVVIDPDARVSHAYVMNNCIGTYFDGDRRGATLATALYAAL